MCKKCGTLKHPWCDCVRWDINLSSEESVEEQSTNSAPNYCNSIPASALIWLSFILHMANSRQRSQHLCLHWIPEQLLLKNWVVDKWIPGTQYAHQNGQPISIACAACWQQAVDVAEWAGQGDYKRQPPAITTMNCDAKKSANQHNCTAAHMEWADYSKIRFENCRWPNRHEQLWEFPLKTKRIWCDILAKFL